MKISKIILLCLCVGLLGGYFYNNSLKEQTVVILATNDMHANIKNFSRLASAVKACRDTTDRVLLLDAGDRWTGDAYVDMADEAGLPIIELMNRLGYDAATLGNHEFDHGQAHLGKMIRQMDCEVVCANAVSDTCTFPVLKPCDIFEVGGFKVGIVGAVTNYEGGDHPAGHASSFVGVRFPDPQEMSMKYGRELRDKCDIMLLLSHMGDDRDAELLGKYTDFDAVIGGHTHLAIDTVVNGTLLTQTYKRLVNVGVTRIHMKGKKVERVEFDNYPLADYAEDEEFAAEVARYMSDPELGKVIGTFEADADKVGLANWMAEEIRHEAKADIGMYHRGGVRLDGIDKGEVKFADLYNLEPFGTTICMMEMDKKAMKKMIISKYNDPVNAKEAHRVDLFSTVPYTIYVDEKDMAYDVDFPGLRDKKYEVAVPDYVFKTYHDMDYTSSEQFGERISNILIRRLQAAGSYTPDNTPRQQTRMPVSCSDKQ